jgi:hypothetical protein
MKKFFFHCPKYVIIYKHFYDNSTSSIEILLHYVRYKILELAFSSEQRLFFHREEIFSKVSPNDVL